MKKLFTFLLAVLMLLTACSNEQTQQNPTSDPSTETSSDLEEPKPTEPEEPVYEGPEHLAYIREGFPIIDGSTSLIPLEAGIRAEIFGKTIEEATKDVNHSTTWGAFEKLLAGEVDMIFTCEMSEEQWKMADEAGVELAAVPVACEGFVFVVNADNPVDVLTQDQLRKIYSGEITNWKEVGGNDAEIIAYQRNYDSGSQNYMIAFMGDVPLMDAPTELRPGSMGGLMDSIAINDYAENSIGYSVYAYAADMYGSGDDIKFIKVDGAEVSKESMAAGEYPLMGYNYAVYNANEPANSHIGMFVEWLTSYEGQLAVAKAGYVTVEDIGFDYSAEGFEKYQGIGTGTAKPEDYKIPGYVYKADVIPLVVGEHAEGIKTYMLVDKLTDKKLNEEINAYIAETVPKLEERYEEYSAEIERIGKADSDGWEKYSKLINYPYSNTYAKNQKTAVIVKAKNGYISVAVTLPYVYNVQDGVNLYYATETAVWDMFSGKRLSVEDLFYEGVDVDEVLNNFMLTDGLDQGMTEFNHRYEMKTDFMGLTAEGDWHIDLDTIYFDYGNRYFEQGAGFDTSNLWGAMVTEQPRDMTECFVYTEQNENMPVPDSKLVHLEKVFVNRELETIKRQLDDRADLIEKYGKLTYELLDERYYPTAEKINKQVEKYLKKYYTREAVLDYFSKIEGFSEDTASLFIWDTWYVNTVGSRYVTFTGSVYNYDEEVSPGYYRASENYYNKASCLIFDLETGEEVTWRVFLSEEGLEKAKEYDIPERITRIDSYYNNSLDFYYNGYEKSIEFTGSEIKWD